MSSEKKKIVIVGAGISGMTAGIYALDNDFEVEIYEKHFVAGGQCTGWNRNNVYIDGCAHWIVGTNKNSEFHDIWLHLGAFNQNTKIYPTEYFNKVDVNGKIVTLYSDVDTLKEEFLRVAPEDKKMINRFIRAIKAYRNIKVPIHKPIDHLNIFELISYGFSMLPVVPYLLKYMHVSVEEFANKFKSIYLRELFLRVMENDYNVHSLLYIMQALSKQDAGMVEGGSRMMANNIKNNFISRGGKVFLNNEVDHILIENDKAKGIVLKNGKVVYADYVIASCDAYHTVNKLLQGKYQDKYYESRFNNKKDNPLQQCFQLSFKVKKDMNPYPKMMNIKIKDYKIADLIIDNISIRNHAFDNVLYKDSVALTVMLKVNENVYDYLKSLTKEKYNEEKEKFGLAIKEEIKQYYEIDEKDIELIDVTTPLTYERYTNAYRGSYMSFLTTKNVKGLMRIGLIKNLNNFVMSGQWIMAPGGLPIAIFTGKHAICRICKNEKKKFKELDKNISLNATDSLKCS